MSQTSDNNKRIAKNTLLLYFRMFLTMGITLYTSRVVLDSLGKLDFGIYNVVGGVVGMFGFLNSSMTASTQRYLTFELGKGNFQALKKVFSLSIQTHAIISLILIFLAETVGLWFFCNKLVIPLERFDAALWVYQCAVVAAVILIMSVPYNAMIVAYEKMSAFAYISILEVSLKLGIVFFLYWWKGDKLIVYAVLLLFVQGVIRLVYGIYCKKHFSKCSFTFVKDKSAMEELFSFAGWNLLGNCAGISFTQGVNIILNMFFGPLVNAARGISSQVVGALNQFSVNLQMALNPQITKSYAANDLEYMRSLVCASSKYTGFLLLILCLPVCLEIDYILHIWLGNNVPEYTAEFVVLSIITTGLDSISNPIMVSANATGKIKKYQVITSLSLMSILPLGYMTLYWGGSPVSIMLTAILVAFVTMLVRVCLIKSMIGLKVCSYLYESIVRLFFVACVSAILPYFLKIYLSQSFVSFVLISIVSVSSALCSAFCLGLNQDERKKIIGSIKEKINKYNAKT